MPLSDLPQALEQFVERRLIDPDGRWNGPMTAKEQTTPPVRPPPQCETPGIIRSARRVLPYLRVSRPHPNVTARVPASGAFEGAGCRYTGGPRTFRARRSHLSSRIPERVRLRTSGVRELSTGHPWTTRAEPLRPAPPRTRPGRPFPSYHLAPASIVNSKKGTKNPVGGQEGQRREAGAPDTAAPGKRTAVDRRTGVAPSGGSRFFSGRPTRKPPGGHETSKRSAAPSGKPAGGDRQISAYKTPRGPAPPSFLIPREREAFPNDVETPEFGLE